MADLPKLTDLSDEAYLAGLDAALPIAQLRSTADWLAIGRLIDAEDHDGLCEVLLAQLLSEIEKQSSDLRTDERSIPYAIALALSAELADLLFAFRAHVSA